MLNEAKSSRPKPELRGRGQFLEVKANAEAKIIMKQESPADAGIPARRKNDEKNSSISKL